MRENLSYRHPFVIYALRFDELNKYPEFVRGDAVVAEKDLGQCHKCLQLEHHLVVVRGRFDVLLGFLLNLFCTLSKPSFLIDHGADD